MSNRPEELIKKSMRNRERSTMYSLQPAGALL